MSDMDRAAAEYKAASARMEAADLRLHESRKEAQTAELDGLMAHRLHDKALRILMAVAMGKTYDEAVAEAGGGK